VSQAPNSSRPSWLQDIFSACALAEQAPIERRLIVFLEALATETVRLIGVESDESGEALIYATICLRALFTDPHVAFSDEEFDQWSSRVHIMLIMESLQRRGYVHVSYEDCAVDPFTSDAPIRIIGTWPESLRKSQRVIIM
jgi:hypothetical protein